LSQNDEISEEIKPLRTVDIDELKDFIRSYLRRTLAEISEDPLSLVEKYKDHVQRSFLFDEF
jgi:hypothetical protein